MPAEIRNLKYCGVEDFKFKLDQFLSQIPDQLVIGSMLPTTFDPITMKLSNSILDWEEILEEFLEEGNQKRKKWLGPEMEPTKTKTKKK